MSCRLVGCASAHQIEKSRNLEIWDWGFSMAELVMSCRVRFGAPNREISEFRDWELGIFDRRIGNV
ncbi:hypothetical protein [Microcoleus sp. B4-D4]|uniref:hypothetical protein n=1 Tax=Microcoleus sp. B4-D4 TaxID=2818667 RepID=UPI002FD7506E